MKNTDFAEKKIHTVTELKRIVEGWYLKSKTFSFVYGCFDDMNAGQIGLLNAAAKDNDFLVVAIHSDESLRRIKGDGYPVHRAAERALLLANLITVDAVVTFDEDNPLQTIKILLPDVAIEKTDLSGNAGIREIQGNGGKIYINADQHLA